MAMPAAARSESSTDMAQEAAMIGGAEPARRRRGWTAAAFILGNIAVSLMGIAAFSTPLTIYLVRRFNMKQVTATNLSNIFGGTIGFSPVAGALVADAFWGRFRTLLFGSVAKLLGMVVITLSASVRQLKPPVCSVVAQQVGTCAGPSGLHRAVLYIGMALLVVGAGGADTTGLPFSVDQFDESNERHKEGLKSYYSWYYAASMMGNFLALTFIVYVQDKVSWGLGFAIPTVLMAVTLAVFLLGTTVYVYVPPEGSIFSSIGQVLVAAFRKRSLRLPRPDDARQQEALLHNPSTGSCRVFKLPLTLQFRFLNKAAVITDSDEIRPDGSPAKPWNLCSIQQVEEVKCVLKNVPIWIAGTTWFVLFLEMGNFALIQSLTMDRRIGRSFTAPQASILAIPFLSVALFVPVYDAVVVPTAKRLTKTEDGLTLLQRQGAGIVIAALAFLVAAIVEHKRRSSALAHGGVSPMSMFWLAPQLVVVGVAGTFSMVGQLELYNTQFPEQMRSVGMAAFACAQGAANYLATAVVSIVNRSTRRHGRPGWVNDDINAGRLDYFYYTMMVVAAVNLVYFLVCAHFYQYKGVQSSGENSDGSDSSVVLLN